MNRFSANPAVVLRDSIDKQAGLTCVSVCYRACPFFADLVLLSPDSEFESYASFHDL